MSQTVIIKSSGVEILRLEIPSNPPGTVEVDAATLSGDALGPKQCDECGQLAVHDGPMGPKIPGTCGCEA